MKCSLWMAGAVLLLTAGLVQADAGWGLFGSYWNTKDGDDAVGPGLRLSIEMVPGIQLELRASRFNNLGQGSGDEAFTLRAIPLQAALVLDAPLGDSARWHAGGGAGSYRFEGRSRSVPAYDPGHETGFFLLGGFEWAVREQAGLFADLQYHWVDAEGPHGPLRLDGPSLQGGLMVRW